MKTQTITPIGWLYVSNERYMLLVAEPLPRATVWEKNLETNRFQVVPLNIVDNIKHGSGEDVYWTTVYAPVRNIVTTAPFTIEYCEWSNDVQVQVAENDLITITEKFHDIAPPENDEYVFDESIGELIPLLNDVEEE